MAATAPARPKPAQSARPAFTELAKPPALVQKIGYVQMVKTFRRALKFCTQIENQILWHIYENTAGLLTDELRERPEWFTVSAPEMAEEFDCSVDAINIAIAALLGPIRENATYRDHWYSVPLIESRKVQKGRGRLEYRVIFQNFGKFKRIEGERAEDGPAEADDEEQQTSDTPRTSPEIIGPRGRKLIRLEKPTATVYHCNEDRSPIEVSHSVDVSDGSVTFFVKSSPLEKTKGVDEASAARGDSIPERENSQERSLSPIGGISRAGRAPAENQFDFAHRVRDLRELIAPIASQYCGEAPTQEWLRGVARKLEGKSLDHFRIQVNESVQKRIAGKLKYLTLGFFAKLAESTPEAAQPPPPAPEIPLVRESEDSGSLWMQIRLAMKERLKLTYQPHEKPYENWFTGTAQARFHAGKLLVVTQDQPIVEMIEQEYRNQIDQVIAELKLPIDRLEFVAQGKLS